MQADKNIGKTVAGSGILLALIAFSGFPIGDAFIKSMAGDWPAPAVAALRFTIGAIALAAILFWREGRAGFQISRPWLHAARGMTLAVGTITFFSAIYIMPLADAVAISFVNPILTALFSGWFLKEKMRPATWIATIVAFGGVLIMLRPNVAAFGWVAILPLFSAVAMAAMLILNRMVSSQRSIFAAQFYIAFWAAIFLSIASGIGHFVLPVMHIPGAPDWDVILRCAIVAVTATSCHFLLYMATMRTTAAAIAPIVYIQLIIASLISVFIFGDAIDPLALVGGGLILLSGLFLWRSERKATTVLEA
ncbi:DMT family transporter [Parasphingorhabdus cellanae]|uniref:DMT family transporter n=1 Tax=Parasphingorhabdus cellanae TaxID=2806553 RepID=A0ABX7T452_9SPHN|nr:DMT family transporter [Parasphingorhabdus cellanae]QTD55595.1 DMT family transporter [Parasphingorhabdus cellanae]